MEGKWMFNGRKRRPPPDPVNLVLSFVSSLLYRDLEVTLHQNGLHPGFGILHSIRDRNFACTSDLVEEFRAPLIESLTLYLFNNRFFRDTDFDVNEDGSASISPNARNTVVFQYEKYLERPIKSPRRKMKITWRRLLNEQVLGLIDHFNQKSLYKPYAMDY
jgi:CRISPR-associated endonuclease Cas1